MSKPLLYLSGCMTNIPESNFPAFESATKFLRYFNYKVISPHENGDKESWEYYMSLDVKYVTECTHIIVLKDWENSRGAKWEVALGQMLKKKILKFPYFIMEEMEKYGTDISNYHRFHCYLEEFEEVEEKLDICFTKGAKQQTIESILQEAERLVSTDRNSQYGDPRDDFRRTAQFWSTILGKEVTAEQVALCMIALKLSRLCFTYKRDSAVDLAGYSKCLSHIVEDKSV